MARVILVPQAKSKRPSLGRLLFSCGLDPGSNPWVLQIRLERIWTAEAGDEDPKNESDPFLIVQEISQGPIEKCFQRPEFESVS